MKKSIVNNILLTRNFSLHEFQDPTTQTVKLWIPFVLKLQQVRDLIGEPLFVVSGFRTPEYNKTLPDALPNSAHLYGLAADVRAKTKSHDDVAVAAKIAGIPRIKIYPSIPGKRLGWVHLGYNDYKL